ncbi:hypothetical protein ACWJJH_09775 [Endozoicomonadaceae bacterium StTr2]
MFLCESAFGFNTARVLSLTQQVLAFLKDPRFISGVAELTESMLDIDPLKMEDDEREYTWEEGIYYEVFHAKGGLLILCKRQDVICPPKTPSATRSNSPVDRGQRLFADDESSSSEEEDYSEDGSVDHSTLIHHMDEALDRHDTIESYCAVGKEEIVPKLFCGWKFVSEKDSFRKERNTITEQEADRYCDESPQVLFRFRCSSCKKSDIDEHISFKTGSEENQLYIVFTRRLTERVFIDFHIVIGNASFNTPGELIDGDSEFGGLGSESIAVSDIFEFIEHYERNYNPDFPEINTHLLSFLGSGVSSQVTWPLYFLHSMVLKRIHRTCKDEKKVQQVIASARANIMLMQLAGIPIAPVAYLYVYNERRRDYVIYAIQPKYDREQFADHVLADPVVAWEDKKKIIDTIIDYLKKCEGPNPLNPTGDPRQGFVFTVDPNFPNYCFVKKKWMLADMSPFFFAVNDEFAIGNHYILNLENNFYDHAKTLCTNPLRRYIFFLGMIYREYLKHKQQCFSYSDIGARDEEAENRSRIWYEIYEYAVSHVFSLPQVRYELCVILDEAKSYVPYFCQTPRFRFEFIEFCIENLESEDYTASDGYYERVKEGSVLKSPDDDSPFYDSADKQDLWDMGAFFAIKINKRVEERKKAKDQKGKDYCSGGRVQSHISRSHGTLDIQECKVFVENALGMQYNVIPYATSENCFLQSVVKSVHKFALQDESELHILQKLKFSLHDRLADSQLARWRLPDRVFFPDCNEERDNIPLLLGVLRDLSGLKCRVLVVYPSYEMKPEGILYQFSSEIEKLVDVRKLYEIEDVKLEASKENTIILVNHHTGPPVFNQGCQFWTYLSVITPCEDSSEFSRKSESNVSAQKGEIFQYNGFNPESITVRFVNEYAVTISKMNRLSALASVHKTVRYQRDILEAIAEYLNCIPLDFAGFFRKAPKKMQSAHYQHEAGSQLYMHTQVIALLDYLYEMYSGSEAYRMIALIQPNLTYGQSLTPYAYWLFYRQSEQQLVGRFFRYAVSREAILSLLQRPGTIIFFSNAFVSKSGHYILPKEDSESAGWWWVQNTGCLYHQRAPDYSYSASFLNYYPAKRTHRTREARLQKGDPYPCRNPFRPPVNDPRLNRHHAKPCASLQ